MISVSSQEEICSRIAYSRVESDVGYLPRSTDFKELAHLSGDEAENPNMHYALLQAVDVGTESDSHVGVEQDKDCKVDALAQKACHRTGVKLSAEIPEPIHSELERCY